MVQKESAQMLNDEQLTQDLQSGVQPFANDVTPETNTTSFNWDELKRIKDDINLGLKRATLDSVVTVGRLLATDAYHFYRAGRSNFAESTEYINNNGFLVNSISELPTEFQDTVRKKVRQQLHVDDAKGLILRPDSTLTSFIKKNVGYKEFIENHLIQLKNGKVINGSVEHNYLYPNVLLTLGNFDVINTYMDKNGNIISYVLDTYEFNPNENLFIDMLREQQLNGYIAGYFSLTMVVIPEAEWKEWLSELRWLRELIKKLGQRHS